MWQREGRTTTRSKSRFCKTLTVLLSTLAVYTTARRCSPTPSPKTDRAVVQCIVHIYHKTRVVRVHCISVIFNTNQLLTNVVRWAEAFPRIGWYTPVSGSCLQMVSTC